MSIIFDKGKYLLEFCPVQTCNIHKCQSWTKLNTNTVYLSNPSTLWNPLPIVKEFNCQSFNKITILSSGGTKTLHLNYILLFWCVFMWINRLSLSPKTNTKYWQPVQCAVYSVCLECVICQNCLLAKMYNLSDIKTDNKIRKQIFILLITL